ncbi:MAG: YifB family Mg chelatase-like AAA ATPase [Clostridia bacterium]|nr:YifB family Mg chelatase-like AAA ATPase [Clostridia bacterium]
MFSSVKSVGLNGLDGYIVNVEATIMNGLTGCEIVGLPDTAVREAKERVLSAIKNIGLSLPYGKIIVNLSPANTRKAGAVFDLPIAISLLINMEVLEEKQTTDYAFIGELSLNGDLKKVTGILPMALEVKKQNIQNLIVPPENAGELSVVNGINIYTAKNLSDILTHFHQQSLLEKVPADTTNLFSSNQQYAIDFSEVKGQSTAKRAIEIAAAGNHNLLMLGSPGSGKTMLAQRIPTILPDLTFEEALEVTKIYSVSGLLSSNLSLITQRPFRSPHHTISNISLVGGGSYPRPGEISLAHNGVLFLDELPEFQKNALEVLRQPLEDRKITISRANASYTFPANFMFVASMNPCPCGYYGSTLKSCTCTPKQIHNYIAKISGPLLDRIDIQLEVQTIKYADLSNFSQEESSLSIRKRVNEARQIQLKRYQNSGIHSNSELSAKKLKEVCTLSSECDKIMQNAFEKLNLSARAYSRVLKVARTIADLEKSQNIQKNHILEAIQYRSLDKCYFGSKN